MKISLALFILLVAPILLWAQAGPKQQEPSSNDSDVTTQLKALRESLLQTQEQVAALQREIEALEKQRSEVADTTSGPAKLLPSAVGVETHTATISERSPTGGDVGTNGGNQTIVAQEQRKEKESPLAFKIGNAEFTPGGFVDIENIFRTTNTGNNIATNFAAIPFSNTPQGNLSEFRTTAQFSRFNLKVTDKFGANRVTGYCEADFSGNDATNVYQSVNGHTLRLRLCFGYLERGKWELLGGQTWSWLTPNRVGVGAMPSDLAITYNEDQNIGVGLPYTRAAELRAAYHPNDHWAVGVGIENPNQFIGSFVALPAAFRTEIGPEFDDGTQIGAPNFFPDILSKLAYDSDIAGRHLHLEATGLVTGARVAVRPIGSKSFSSQSTIGGGGQVAGNVQLSRNLIFLANAFWSNGGAHYLVATGPQVVIRPNDAGTNVAPSMVRAGAGSAGLEWKATPKTVLAAYYGADYYGRNFFPDTTNTAHPGTIIGYGGPGSPNTNNRALQQPTFDLLHTFWQSPRYGALVFYTQYSYLTRSPWFVAPGEPKNAHLSMVYMGFRYVLPTMSGTLR